MPKLLLTTTKRTLLERIQQGKSINAISKELNLAKSTIYYHYKKIKGRKFTLPQFTPSATEQEGEICGIFAGDGSQYFEPKKYLYQVNVHFGIANKTYAEHVQKLFQTFFQKKFRLYQDRIDVLRLRTESKAVFYYFKHYLDYISQHKHDTVKLKNLNLPESFKKGFLRGLIDTDGSVLQDKTGRTIIAYYTTSRHLAEQTHQMLNEFGIKSSIQMRHDSPYKPMYRTYV